VAKDTAKGFDVFGLFVILGGGTKLAAKNYFLVVKRWYGKFVKVRNSLLQKWRIYFAILSYLILQ